MDIDVYQQCPCHAEKKIKFCCGKGIIGDLNQILAKNRSGQPASALEQLERVIENLGPKDCLLTLQTHILISLGEIEKAKESNALFLSQNPQHPTGLHHLALIHLSEGKSTLAVEALQDAMDAIVGNEIPISLSNAFRILGLALYQEGDFVASQAHLRYASALKGDSDQELMQLVSETFRSPEAPIVVKQEFQLASVPESVEWAKRYFNVHRALDRGQFRKALKFLIKIDEEHPDLPLVLRGMAIVNSYLGRREDSFSAWRRLSQLQDISRIEAVEAEMMSQFYNPQSVGGVNPIKRLTYELADSEGAFELAVSHSRLKANPIPESDPFQEGPAPRLAFSLLSHDQCRSAEGLTIETIPNVIGEVWCFGKQTDRPARLELVTLQDSSFDGIVQFMKETFGSFEIKDPIDTTIGQSSELAELFEWHWELPPDATREQHAELVSQKRKSILLKEWPKLKLAPLDNRSPEDCSGDSEMELPLLAMILVLENTAEGLLFDDDLAEELKAKLGLEPLASIDASEDGIPNSPIQQQMLRMDKLSDEQLVAVRNAAIPISNFRVLKRVVPEILNRPELTAVPRDLSYSMMAQLTKDDEKALEFMSLARTEAQKADRPIGVYLVQEFEFRLSRGITEKLTDLLQTLQKNHMQDPEVEYQLTRILSQYGLAPGQEGLDDQVAREEQTTLPEESEPGGALWTPEHGGQPTETKSPDRPGSSDLWIPE